MIFFGVNHNEKMLSSFSFISWKKRREITERLKFAVVYLLTKKKMILLRCKVVFDLNFLRWPNQTFYTSDRYVNNCTCFKFNKKNL